MKTNGSWQCTALITTIVALACRAIGGPLQLISTSDPAQTPPAGGGGASWSSIISPDGRYVLFASSANNMVQASPTNPIPARFPPRFNVFLRDRTSGTTTLVSVNFSGTAGGNGDSMPSALSTNGQYALFESSASDLVRGDTNNATDIFVRDLVNGTNLLVSISTNHGMANGASRSAVMTPDGHYVAFVSDANNLVPNDTNRIPDVFVRDLQAGTTTLVSVGARSTNSVPASGLQLIPNAGSSESPDITPDGRYVAFYSGATNLVPGVTTTGDIYVRDLVGGTTTWASSYARTALKGTANIVCYNQMLSADGQFVAYQASPTTSWLVSPGAVLRYSLQTGLTDIVHTNADFRLGAPEYTRSLEMTPDGRFIVYVANYYVGGSAYVTCLQLWDAQSGTNTLVSVDRTGSTPKNNSTWHSPVLDPTGRYVVFLSSWTNLVTNALSGQCHVYIRDMQAGTTTLVDADPAGRGSGVSPITAPQMSADARYVVFEAPDGTLVPNDNNRQDDVFVRDVVAGTNELISARDPALPALSADGVSTLSQFSLSTDGRYVAFASDADNLAPRDTNGVRDIFVRDLVAGTNALVSVATNGFSANSLSTDSAISGDGRYVAFTSSASNLVARSAFGIDVTFTTQNVFVRDLQAETTALVSSNYNTVATSGNAASYSPSISADGRFVLYRSLASNLAPGSFTPGVENLFQCDLLLGTNYALTHMTSGSPSGAMTPDGRFVAFSGLAAPLSSTCLCVWDSQLAQLVYTNAAITGISNVAVSADGNRIAYATGTPLYELDRAANTTKTIATNVFTARSRLRLSGDGRFLTYVAPLNGTNQVFLSDFQGPVFLLVSSRYGTPGAADGVSDSPDISPDGRFVAYRSAADNIVPFDTNGVPDVFLYDRVNGTTMLLSASRLGSAATENRSLTPVFTADSQTLAFESWGSDLAAQDFNQGSDLFAYSLYASGQIPLFSAAVICGPGTGHSPWVTWPVLANKTYQVQYKDDLNDPAWQTLSGAITLLGSQAYLNDVTAGPTPRFYRVVAY